MQARAHSETGAGVEGYSNVLSRGDGATLSWCYDKAQAEMPACASGMNCTLLIVKNVFCRFMAILGCKYAFVSDNPDLVAVFRNCVGQYAKNASILTGNKVSWVDAHRKLLAHAYRWLLYHYDQPEAHVIHQSLIVHSFFWLACAKSFDDRNRYGRIPFNPKYWMENVDSGCTAMSVIGDPLSKADKLYSTLTTIFDDVRLQRLAVRTPCRENYKNQEDEIVRHLANLASDKAHDAFPLPASVPKAILVLGPAHRWWGQIPNAPEGIVTQRLAQMPLMVMEA